MSDHDRELPGFLESVAGDKVAEAASDAARKAAADKRAAAHDAAVTALSLLHGEAAGYLALRMQEACIGAQASYQRVLVTLKELGVRLPPGILA